MKLSFSLSLPRDSATVPVVRRTCRDALKVLGVSEDCIDSIQVAVSEACTNVLKHVEGTPDAYEVDVSIDERVCSISVIDTGSGFDQGSLDMNDTEEGPSVTSEGGRGIFLMRAMVDQIKFTSEPENGTIVHLVKTLDLEPDS